MGKVRQGGRGSVGQDCEALRSQARSLRPQSTCVKLESEPVAGLCISVPGNMATNEMPAGVNRSLDYQGSTHRPELTPQGRCTVQPSQEVKLGVGGAEEGEVPRYQGVRGRKHYTHLLLPFRIPDFSSLGYSGLYGLGVGLCMWSLAVPTVIFTVCARLQGWRG